MLEERNELATTDTVRLTLKSPSALSVDLLQKLNAALDRAEDVGSNAHLEIEICGMDCLADFTLWPGATDVLIVNKWEQMLRRIERMQTLSAVSAHGHCTAEALELLLVADHRAVSQETYIHLSARNHDVWPSMALHRLCHQIGYARARRSMLFGDMLTGGQLQHWGVVDSIAAGQAPFDVREWRLVANDPGDLPMRRRLLQDAVESSFDEALGAHLAACDRALKRRAGKHATPDMQSDETNVAKVLATSWIKTQ